MSVSAIRACSALRHPGRYAPSGGFPKIAIHSSSAPVMGLRPLLPIVGGLALVAIMARLARPQGWPHPVPLLRPTPATTSPSRDSGAPPPIAQ
jgi:hypothetical protein